MRTEQLTSCFKLLQKLRARLESRLTGLSPTIHYRSLQCGTSDFVHCVACFGSFLYCFHLLCVFNDIGSDCMVTLMERAAHSVYNMFSVPCKEKIIEPSRHVYKFNKRSVKLKLNE